MGEKLMDCRCQKLRVAYGNVDGAFTGSRVKTGAVGERDAENDEPGVEHELDRGYAAVIRVGRFHSRCNRSEVEEGSLDLVYGISWTGQFKYRAAMAPACRSFLCGYLAKRIP